MLLRWQNRLECNVAEACFGVGTRWRAKDFEFIDPQHGLSPLETDQGIVWRELIRLQSGSPAEQADAAFVISFFLRKYGRRVKHSYMVRRVIKVDVESTTIRDEWGIPVRTTAEGIPTYKWFKMDVEWTVINFICGFPQYLIDVILSAPGTMSVAIRDARAEVKETGKSEVGDVLVKRDPGLYTEIFGEIEDKNIALEQTGGEPKSKKYVVSAVILGGTILMGLVRLLR